MTPAELAAAVIESGGLRVQATDPTLLRASSATVAFVAGLPVVADRATPTDPWPDQVKFGAVLLASRLYRRKDSPSGVISLDASAPGLITKYDSDIERMLGLNVPQVG